LGVPSALTAEPLATEESDEPLLAFFDVPDFLVVLDVRVDAFVEVTSSSGSPSNTATAVACAFALFLVVIGPLLDLVTLHPTSRPNSKNVATAATLDVERRFPEGFQRPEVSHRSGSQRPSIHDGHVGNIP
jgi:hypothetical protein